MIFLTVPYAEKDDARALGARWNPTRKRWYVPDGVDVAPFAKWHKEDGGAAAGGAAKIRVDSATAKLAVGANYIELPHACNPFEPCPECEGALAGTPWRAARTALQASIAALKPR
jgi:hypothetical protein